MKNVSASDGNGSGRASTLFYYAICFLVLIVGCVEFVRLALYKNYSMDEFQYAHAAWLTSQGYVVYRDFFECHLPLVYQVLSPLFHFLSDSPDNMIYLRLGMTVVFALCGLSAFYINRGFGLSASVAAPAFLALVTPYSVFASDVRPDPFAFSLFVAAMACPFLKIRNERIRGFVCGVLIAATAWASQKAFVYCLALFAVFLSDAVRWLKSKSCVLGNPASVVFGFVTGFVPVAAYLSLTHSFDDMWHWCFGWAMIHQREYTKISWLDGMEPLILSYPWVLLFSLFGFVETFRRVRASGTFAASPDTLLLLALPSTFFSVSLQRAPFPYSHVPLIGVLCILGARGVAVIHGTLAARYGMFQSQGRQQLLGGVLLLLLTAVSLPAVETRIGHRNSYQQGIQSEIGRLTNINDACYDNSGSYVSRPHSYFYFYTDYVLRKTIASTLAREVPDAIIRSETVLMIKDPRFETLPDSLKEFLDSNFQAYNDDIYLWGKKMVSESDELTTSFHAIKSGEYFITPSDLLTSASLEIDGKSVTGHRFHLEKGSHEVRLGNYRGECYLLWLPRNGKTYEPKPNPRPRYVTVF